MKKVKSNVKFIALAIAVSAVMTGAGYQYMTNASESQVLNENSIGLNVEKQSKDKIKVYLSNFSDLATSLQLSIKIEEGNVKFDENSINWLINEENVQTNYKIDNDKKTIDFFIVSNEPINTDGGKVDICEINVSKDESIVEALLGKSNKGYKVVPNVVDGEAYSYVTYSSNKKVSGDNIANVSDEVLTMNTNPTIRFKKVPSVVNDQIIIFKGSVFNINDYVEAYDSEGNEIKDIKYDGKVDNKNVGTYNIVCKVTDSYGDSSTLEASVSVEEPVSGERSEPKITGNDKPLEIIIGKEFDLEEGIEAVDYMGRPLDLTIGGNFDTDKVGTYLITYSATDIFNKTTTVERTLIVKEENTNSDGGNNNSSTGNSNSNSGSSSSNSGNDSLGLENNDLNNSTNSNNSSENLNDNIVSSDNVDTNEGIITTENNNTSDYVASSTSENANNKTNNNSSQVNNTVKDKISNITKPKKDKNSQESIEENEEIKELEEEAIEIEAETIEVTEDDKEEINEEKDTNTNIASEEKSSNNILSGVVMSIMGIGAVASGFYFRKKK